MYEPIIQIQKAANGWIVVLPRVYDAPPDMNWLDSATVKKVAGMFKEEYAKDPVLENLGHYETQPVQPVGQQRQQNNIHIFTTYDAASDFIKERYDN